MTSPSTKTFDLGSFCMLMVLSMVWGGSFFFAKVAVEEISPITITLHRVFWALPFLALVLYFKGIPLPTAPRIWGAYLVMGALNNALPFSLIFWSQQFIESGLAAIINGTSAMITAVIAALFFADEPLSAKKIIGAGLGLLGIVFIMGFDSLSQLDPRSLAQLAVIGAALSYAFAAVWGRAQLSSQPPLMNAFGMLCGSSVLMLPLVIFTDGFPRFDLSPHTWGALLGLATLSTAMAYVLYFAIMRRAGAANLVLVTLLAPPFAIALGVLFLNEILPPEAWLGFGIIALGFAVTDGRLFARFFNKSQH